MHRCPDCDFEAKSKGGLGGHRRAKHPADAADVSVVAAVRDELGARVSTPLGASALMLARAMDDSESARDLPALAKELRTLLSELGDDEATEAADGVDDLAARRAARRAAASSAVGS